MPTRAALRSRVARIPGGLSCWRLARLTVRLCLRHRVTGLASEAGFFALLSLPPLVLGLFAGLGYVGTFIGPDRVDEVVRSIEVYATRFLSDDSISAVLVPTVDEVFRGGRGDLVSLGFLLSLWSGSRALNVFVDTISIMYGQSGVRGIVRTRALSFTLYTLAVLLGAVVVPLVLLGPELLAAVLPGPLMLLETLYWPTVGLAGVAALTSLFHIATPRRSPWARDLPGAALAVALWLASSWVVRTSLAASIGGTSIYGPLASPIVLLIWLYTLAIAVLIGAAMNASVRQLWPVPDRASTRARVVELVRDELDRRRSPSPWGPVMAGLVTPVGGATRTAGGLDSTPRHRLVSVSTHSG